VVVVRDAFDNLVNNEPVQWLSLSGGSASPSNSITDALGRASTAWRFKNSIGLDSLLAIVPSIPDTAKFYAQVLSSTADSLQLISGNGQSGIVGLQFAQALRVQVVDSVGNNPVPDIPVSFVVDSLPSGGVDYSFSANVVNTDANGYAETFFTAGTKAGVYKILAVNQSLKGNPTFRLTANAAAADTILIVTGNNQSGTAGSALTNAVTARVTDAYGNPVSGVTVNWTPTADGQASPSSAVSSATGLVQTSWILRTLAGSDTLNAGFTGFTGNTFARATAGHGTPASITAYAGDNRTGFPGSGRTITALVSDQYGNPVTDAVVNFLPLNRVSESTGTTGTNGRVQSIYTLPIGLDSSEATAYVSGLADTARFKLYAVRYVAGSLSPKLILPNTTENFYLTVNNPGVDAVTPTAGSTTFSFTDGTSTATAVLDSPAVIAANTTTTLKFANVAIPGTIEGGNFTPVVNITGTSGGSTVSGELQTGPGELSISPLDIRSVAILHPASKTISRGDTLQLVTMTVRNNSSYTINNFLDSLTFSQAADYKLIRYGTNPTELLAGTEGTFRFRVAVPSDAPLGSVSVDGYISGTLATNGHVTYDNTAQTTDAFTVEQAAVISYSTYTPQTISQNQAVSFAVTVFNSGAANVLLSQSLSQLTFDGQNFTLSGNQTVNGSTTTILNFTSTNIGLAPGKYAGSLLLRGTENGASFSTTLAIDDSLTVQAPAALVLNSLTLSDTEVSQGESTQSVSLSLTNTGTAGVRISSVDSVMFSSGLSYQPQLTSGQTFPLSINGGASTTLIFRLTVAESAVTGPDAVSAVIGYTDINSGSHARTAQPGASDSWTILAKSQLVVDYLTTVPGKVSQGQSGIIVTAQITNTGEVAANFDATSALSLQFKRNLNSYTLVSPLNPVLLVGGASQVATVAVAVPADAATGIDSMRVTVSGTNTRTGAAVSVASGYLDGWNVQRPPSMQISSVTSTLNYANSGQQGIPILLTLRNQGQATALIDSVGLKNLPSGATTDLLTTALDSITGGSAKTYSFTTDIDAGFSGNLYLDGFYGVRDGNSNLAYTDTGAVVTDSLVVGSAATLVIDSVYTTTNTMTLGQSGVSVKALIHNAGSSSVKVDSLRFKFNGLNSHSVLTAVRVVPSTLPILISGQSFVAEFRLTAAAAPVDTGLVTLDLAAYGTDQTTAFSVAGLSAQQTDVLRLQAPALLEVVRINNPYASVTRGQENIPDTLVVRNSGGATARLNSVQIDFRNGNTYYNRTLIDPSLPVDINGGDSVAVAFNVAILPTAPLDTVSQRGIVQGVELNRNSTLNNTSAYLDTWQVLGVGGLNLLSVQSAYDSVSTGQDSIPVIVRVENAGSNPVIVDSLRLRMKKGNYVTGTLSLRPGTTLGSSSSAQFNFSVSAQPSSPTGIEVLNASVYGRDISSGAQVSDTSAEQTDTWLIMSAVSVASNSISPTQISPNQLVSPSVQIRNNGQAMLQIDTSRTRLQSGLYSRSLTTQPVLNGNSTIDLNFSPILINDAPGKYPVFLHLVGNENNSYYNQNILMPDSLWIQSPATVVIDSIVAGVDTVTQGMSAAMKIYARNTGEADLLLDSLTINPYGTPASLNPAAPLTMTGGSAVAFDATVDIPVSAVTGLLKLDAAAYGRDANNNASVSTPGALLVGEWEVLPRAIVAIDTIYSVDSVVVRGQTNIPVSIVVSNSGGTAVQLTALNVLPAIGLYTQVKPSLPVLLQPFSSDTLVDYLTVRSNSATGDDTLRAVVNYTNTVSGISGQLTQTPAEGLTWNIQQTANVNILSVLASPLTVSKGQRSVTVRSRVQNAGTATARINAIDLNFKNGNGNYDATLVSPSLPFDLNSGITQSFVFAVDVVPTAAVGPDTIDAQLTGVELASNLPLNITNAIVADNWVVQQRPVIQIDSVRIEPLVASTSQNNLYGQLFISNANQPYTATASIDSLSIDFSVGASDESGNFAITRFVPPSLPLSLPAGQSSVIDFDVDVSSSALIASYLMDGYARYTDINDGISAVVTDAASTGSLDVQQRAVLQISEVYFTPDTVSQSQENVAANIVVDNIGGANGDITYSTLTFSPSQGFNFSLTGTVLPLTIPGGGRDTLVYNMDISPSVFGDVAVSGIVRGRDDNSSAATGDTLAANLFVQTAANPAWAGSTLPGDAPLDSAIQFVVKVVNSGQAPIILDSTKTYLSILTTPITTYLAGNSPVKVIGSGDTTTLLFRPKLINAVAVGDYALQATLVGSSNSAPFSNNISVGQVNIGGDISILSIQVSDNFVVQGQPNITGTMTVGNNGIPLPIDSVDTKLVFRDASNAIVNMANLSRTDTLTVLRKVPNNELGFRFDIPANLPQGRINIYGQISLDGGTKFKQTQVPLSTFNVLSDASVNYVTSTLSPSQVVPRQQVPLSIALYDSGTSALTLMADSTYLTVELPVPVTRYLGGNFVLAGAQETVISFASFQVPAGTPAGKYAISGRVVGEQVDGDILRRSFMLEDSLEVLNKADMQIASIDIVPDIVRWGETGVRVNYLLENAGASDGLLKSFTPRFNKGAAQASGWVQSNISPGFPDTLDAATNRMYQAEYVIGTPADTGVVTPNPFILYNDLRTPSYTDTVKITSLNDSIRVVAPAVLRIDSLIAVAGTATPNVPRVNLDQPFELRGVVRNLGGDPARNIHLSVLRNGNLMDQLQITEILPGTMHAITILDTLASVGEYLYSVRIDSAFDPAGTDLVSLLQPLDNTERIQVDVAALMAYQSVITSPVGALDSIITVGQEVRLTTSVNFSGTAPLGNGSVRMTVPANYQFVPAADSVKAVTPTTTTLNWTIKPIAASLIPFDTLLVSVKDSLVDINTGNPAQVATASNRILLRSEPQSAIPVAISLISPAGATDSTLSTGQTFSVRGVISFNAGIADTGRTATLQLPNGFAVIGSSVQALPDAQDAVNVDWQVRAPLTAATNQLIRVLVNASDANSGAPVTGQSSSLPVTVVARSEISVRSDITGPAGAKDLVVSTGQLVNMNFWIRDYGFSGFDNSGVLHLSATNGVQFTSTNRDTLQVNGFVANNQQVYSTTLRIPQSGLTSSTLTLAVKQVPLDVNSLEPVVVRVDTVQFTLQVVPRADLAMQVLMPEINVRLINQDVNVRAVVLNNGTANVDSGYAAIQLTNGLTLLSDAQVKYALGDTMTWTVRTPSAPALGQVSVFADTSEHVAPLDENDGSFAFRSDHAFADTVYIDVKSVSAPNLATVTFTDPAVNDSVTVSSDQDSVIIRVVAQFNPLLNMDRFVRLTLPDGGYTVLDSSLTYQLADTTVDSYELFWHLSAPQKAVNWGALKVTASSRSAIYPSAPAVTSSNTQLRIKTVLKANLVVASAITEPEGAIDGTVSAGQYFKVTANVNNIGQAAVANGSFGQIRIVPGTAFTLCDTCSASYSYTAGSVVDWGIVASASTAKTKTASIREQVLPVLNARPRAANGLGMQTTDANGKQTTTIIKEVFGSLKNSAKMSQAANDIIVELQTTPDDENTHQPAFALIERDTISVTIESAGTITVLQRSFPDTISSGQTFNYSATISMLDNVSDAIAMIELPDGFTTVTPVQSIPSTGVVTWAIAAPENFTDRARRAISVAANGIDQNNGTEVSSNVVEDSITVYPRASLKLKARIVSPELARDTKIVSFGQSVVLAAWPENVGQAGFTGTGRVTLQLVEADSFKLVTGTVSQFFGTATDSLNPVLWTVKAPTQEINATTLKFTIDQVPNDQYSNAPVLVTPENGSASMALSSRRKQIRVTNLNYLLVDQNFQGGAQAQGLLAFEVSNEGFSGPEGNIFIDSLSLGFIGSNDSKLIDPAAVISMLDAVEIVNYQKYKNELPALAKGDVNFATLPVTAEFVNPQPIGFSRIDSISAGAKDTMVVRGTFKSRATSRSFRVVLRELSAYDVDPNIGLNVVDAAGTNLDESTEMESDPLTVVPPDAKEAFYNYPNPFGRDEDFTTLNFYVERDSDVEIRIFTLTGGLVRTWPSTVFPRGVHTSVIWDGRNDRGKQVLNGVYLCQIRIQNTGGGGSQTYITKIAYIK
jgi:hypothetical protein